MKKLQRCEQRRRIPKGIGIQPFFIKSWVSSCGNARGETAKSLPVCKAVSDTTFGKMIYKERVVSLWESAYMYNRSTKSGV